MGIHKHMGTSRPHGVVTTPPGEVKLRTGRSALTYVKSPPPEVQTFRVVAHHGRCEAQKTVVFARCFRVKNRYISWVFRPQT